MSFERKLRSRSVAWLLVAAIGVSACSSGGDGSNAEKAKDPDKEQTPSVLKIGNKMFSVPSPIQTAFDLKQAGATFNPELLNNPDKVDAYSTRFSQAVNMGVYGADLGYALVNRQTQEGLKFLASCKKISNEMGMASVFTNNLLDRFGNNIENTDSLLSLVGEAYLLSDSYLKENKSEELGILILAGGWVESMYFATSIAINSDSDELRNRVGQQRSSLENLLALLSRLENRTDELENLLVQLKDLQSEYRDVDLRYTYEAPETNPDQKLTVINSRSEARITQEKLQILADKIAAIRNQLVG
ncbi:MAG: hypothetical protein ACFB10_05670 [Salibacteraceae bacterium]